jgi:hypothetical protein
MLNVSCFRLLVRNQILSAAALSLLTSGWGAAADADTIASDFANPPDSARPWVWGHWLHGNVDKASITRGLESMKRAGLGGVTMFDVAQPGIPAGPNRYMSPEWQALFAWQIREAKRIGLEVMSHLGPGYSGSGGPWIPHEFASQRIYESSVRHRGGARFSGKLPAPETPGGFFRDVAVMAVRENAPKQAPMIEDFDMKRLVWLNYIRWKGVVSAPPDARIDPSDCIRTEAVVDLTALVKPDGSLDWDAPQGDWTILRFGHGWTGQNTLPATPEGEGPECDKLDKRGIRAHFDHVMKRMIELAGPEAGRTFHTFFVDSWEAGGQNWTERMPGEFQRRRGYDPRPFLPVLTGRVLGDLQTSERFLLDLRLTVSELVTENFWAELRRLCDERGMRLAFQPYITTGNDFDAANHADEPMGEFWSHPFQPNDYSATVKLASSAANLNGRLIVGAEAFTADETERWLSHPAKLKEQGDRMFCMGANRFQFHRFAMQRFPQVAPGMTMGKWGQHYDSTQTWWDFSKPWHDYLARCQYLLRKGPLVTDVLALTTEEPLWRFEPLPIKGHDYDVCGPDAFKRVTMTGDSPGLPGGPSYRLITVAHEGGMSLDRLRKLRDMVHAGAALLGEPPARTPGLPVSPENDAALKSICLELWGDAREQERSVGKGRVFRGISAADALKRLGVPADFKSTDDLTWCHRRSGDMDIYFIATPADQSSTPTCTFRVSGKQAELWNPETGAIHPLDVTSADDGCSSVRIPLGPDGSAFVVFRSPADTVMISSSAPRAASHSGTNPIGIGGPWTLTFPASSGVVKPLSLDELASWSAITDPNVRYFSGTAVYSKDIEIENPVPGMMLDLGKVEVMARVKLNGRDLGILWKPPYQVDISKAAVPGKNQLEIEVVNLWVNRMIGDQSLPEDSDRDPNGVLKQWPEWLLSGKTSPTGRRSFVTFPLWKKNDPLQPSGLLGPVKLKVAASGER